MASCVRNIRTKNYHDLIIGFQDTVKNVRASFLRHSVYPYIGVRELFRLGGREGNLPEYSKPDHGPFGSRGFKATEGALYICLQY